MNEEEERLVRLNWPNIRRLDREALKRMRESKFIDQCVKTLIDKR